MGNFAKKAIANKVSKHAENVILEKAFGVLPKEKLITQIDQSNGLVITPVNNDDIVNYIVNDPKGNLRYLAKVNPEESTGNLYVVNANGEDCAVIRKKSFSFAPTYLVRAGNQTLGLIKRGRKAPNLSYYAKYLGWKVHGNSIGYVYKVMEGKKTVLTISRDRDLGLALDFAVVSNSNELSGVILALVIDMIFRNDLQ